MGISLLERPGNEVEVVCDGPEARLCAAMGLLNAATAEVVAAIAEALDNGGWQGDGIVTIEHWVTLRCGVTSSRARRLVAMAGALGGLPAAAGAFAEGALSEDQVGVMCAHVDAAHDAEVTQLARRSTVGQLRRILPSIVAPEPVPDPVPDRQPLGGEDGDAGAGLGDVPGRRETAFGNSEDGRWWARVLLAPDEGALVQKALEASRDALFRAGRPDHDDHGVDSTIGWSDALVHMAEMALSNIEGTGAWPPIATRSSSTSTPTIPSAPACTSGRCCRRRCATTWPATPPGGWCSSARARPFTCSPAGAPSTIACGRWWSSATGAAGCRGAAGGAGCMCTTSSTPRPAG